MFYMTKENFFSFFLLKYGKKFVTLHRENEYKLLTSKTTIS